MNLFEIVKYGVSCREAAERYGVEVNHYGMALCPFHNDRHPSLYVADDHYYCFACGAQGDVIDFVGRLFQLSPYDAARKLMADFHLSPDKPPSAAALHAKHIRTEAQQLMENERLYFLFCPIMPVSCGTGRCSMRRSHLTSLFTHGLRKPVASSTKRNTIWIFCAPGILTNALRWCSSRCRTASWMNCARD